MNEKPKEQASEWTTHQMNKMTNERSNDNRTNETRLEFHENMNQMCIMYYYDYTYLVKGSNFSYNLFQVLAFNRELLYMVVRWTSSSYKFCKYKYVL